MTAQTTIRSIDLWDLEAPIEPIADSRYAERAGTRRALWLRLTLSDGTVGWGEAGLFGAPPEVVVKVIEADLLPLIGTTDATAIHLAWDRMYQSTHAHGRRGLVLLGMSAIDVALWDALARRADLPLADVLGRYSDRVKPYASCGFYGPDKSIAALSAEGRRLHGAGFRAFKMKVGRQPRRWANIWDKEWSATFDEDVARVFAMREAIGPECELLVDANTEWDAQTTIHFLRETSAANLFFIEEPVTTDIPRQAADVRAHVGTVRVAGFETEYTRYAYRDLLETGAIDVVQPDACWCGGLSEARRIAAMASAYGKLCVPHSISSALSFHVNAQFVASLDNAFLVEWDCTGSALMDRFTDPAALENGWLTLPRRPGIGLDLQPADLQDLVKAQWTLDPA